MALKTILTAAEYGELNEALQAEYEEADDGYRLSLDGTPPGYVEADKLNEFRTNNRKLNRAAQERKARIEALEAELEEAKSANPGDGNDSEVAKVSARLAKMEKMHAASEEARLAAEAKVQQSLFSRAVRRVAKDGSVLDSAMDDFINRVERDGFALSEDGKSVEREDGTTLAEDIPAYRKATGYYFADSQGGNTPPGSPRGKNDRGPLKVKKGSFLANADKVKEATEVVVE